MKKTKISVCSSLFLLLGCTGVENSKNPFPVHFSNENLKDICGICAGKIEFSENRPFKNELQQWLYKEITSTGAR